LPVASTGERNGCSDPSGEPPAELETTRAERSENLADSIAHVKD